MALNFYNYPPPRYRGKKCTKTIEIETRTGECTPDTVPACPAVAGAAYIGQWSAWTKCVSACEREGKRMRVRQCVNGDDCAGGKEGLVQEEPCPAFCPPRESDSRSRMMFLQEFKLNFLQHPLRVYMSVSFNSSQYL